MTTTTTAEPTTTGKRSGFAIGSRAPISTIFIAVMLLTAILAPILPVPDPAALDLNADLDGPSWSHLLGTDELGRDLLSRLIFGTRTTVFASLTALIVTTIIGLPLGLVAGYWRGLPDSILSWAADAIMAVPPLVLILVAITAFEPGITKSMLVLGLVLSPRLFRVVRASTIGLTNSGYLEVGRMSGCPTPRMITRYVLPNVRAQVVVQLSLLLGYAALTEAGISFLGLGAQPPMASLGVLLKSGVEYLDESAMLTIAPGVLLTGFILSCNLLGDSYTAAKEDT